MGLKASTVWVRMNFTPKWAASASGRGNKHGDYLAGQKRHVVLERQLPYDQRGSKGIGRNFPDGAELCKGQALSPANEKAEWQSPFLLVYQEEGRAD